MRYSLRSLLVPVLGAALIATAAVPALAGGAPIVLAQDDPDPAPDAPSAAALLVRVDRLENKLRTLTGQIEQLQFQNKRLEDALRKTQQDVDFRFQDLNRAPVAPGGKPPLQRRGDLGDASPDALADAAPDAPAAEPPTPAAAPPAAPEAKPQRRGDAFDPATDPGAPGAPRPLGAGPPVASPPLRSSMPPAAAAAPSGSRTAALPSPADQPRAPLDLTHGANAAAAPVPPPADAAPAAPPSGVASLTPGSTRGEYEADYGLYKGAQYEAAVAGFNDFLGKYPRDRLVPDATYFLGESYARLGRHREAAEQFLKLSTDFTKSNRAPDALLRLGMALNALGAGAQACATYQEVDRKYPAAGPDLRAAVDRELKRAHC